MNQKKWNRIVSIYSVIYTVITLLSSVLYLCSGVYEDPSGNWHELDRAIILLIGVAAFEIIDKFNPKNLEENVDVFDQALKKYLAEYQKVGICPKHFGSMTEFSEDYNKEISENI